MTNRVFSNALWIISCKVVQAVLTLIVSMLTARYLGPANYGLINYAASLVAFATPIMRLGLSGIFVQEIVQEPDQEGQTLGTAIIMNIASGMLAIIGVIAFAILTNAGERDTIIVCALYSGILLAQAIEIIMYWFQAKLLSKYTSLSMLAAYAISAIYRIYLLITEKSIYWFAISNTLDILIIDVLLSVLYKKNSGPSLCFSLLRAKQMFSKSKYYIISDLMVVVFAQTDRIMLKMMIGDTATGYYSAAVACAGMTSFVFSAIIDSARPSIFASKQTNQLDFEKKTSQLYSIIFYFALVQSVVIAMTSPLIVGILYGSDYQPTISALRIIVWYTTFSYLGSVRNIWILAEGKQKLLWKINLSGAVANVLLNALLIPLWGVNGAAFASLVTQVFTNVVTGYIFADIRQNNRLMVKGLDLKIFIRLVSRVVKN